MSKDKPRDIGVDVEAPANPDGDVNDPFLEHFSKRTSLTRNCCES